MLDSLSYLHGKGVQRIQIQSPVRPMTIGNTQRVSQPASSYQCMRLIWVDRTFAYAFVRTLSGSCMADLIKSASEGFMGLVIFPKLTDNGGALL